MTLRVSGKNFDIGDALRQRVAEIGPHQLQQQPGEKDADHQGADDRDRGDRVGEGHQGRVQEGRDTPDDLEPDHRGQDEDVQRSDG